MTKNKLIRGLLLFLAGGFLYCIIEVVTRGYSHYSMLIAGGICFLFIGRLNEKEDCKMPVVSQMVLSAIFITTIELITGLIVNVWLGMNVWDYSDLPYNFHGQICLLYINIWFLLSFAAIVFDDYLKYWLMDGEKPKYKFW